MTSDISTTITRVEFSTLSMLSLLALFLLERHGSLAEYREIREFLSVVVMLCTSSKNASSPSTNNGGGKNVGHDAPRFGHLEEAILCVTRRTRHLEEREHF